MRKTIGSLGPPPTGSSCRRVFRRFPRHRHRDDEGADDSHPCEGGKVNPWNVRNRSRECGESREIVQSHCRINLRKQ